MTRCPRRDKVNNAELTTIVCSGTEEKKREIFKRINTLGIPLSRYEVLNGLHHGEYLEGLDVFIRNDKNARHVLPTATIDRGDNKYHLLEYVYYVRHESRFPKKDELDEYVKQHKDESFNDEVKNIKPYISFIRDVLTDKSKISAVLKFKLSVKYLKERAIWLQHKDAIYKEVNDFMKSPFGRRYEEVFISKAYEGNCPFFISVEKDGYEGVLDLNGNVLISPNKYKSCSPEYYSLKVKYPNGEERTLPAVKIDQSSRFDYKPFDNLYYAFNRNSDKTLKTPTGYTYHVKSDGKYMNVYTPDKKQLILSSNTYKQIDVVAGQGQNWCYIVSKSKTGGPYGLLDRNGKEIAAPEMVALESAGTGYLRYKLNGFWGLMNYQGKVLIDTNRGYTSIGDYKSFNKWFAYTMNGYKGECDATGKQISKIKVDTPRQNTSVASSSGTSSSSSSGTSSSSSSGGTTTIHVEHHHTPVPVQQWQACFACGGTGKMGCDFCGGSGTKYIGDRLDICSRCRGHGEIPCNVCYGNKGQYITVNQ